MRWVVFACAWLLAAGSTRAQEPNTLTPAETAQGWQLMFDGKSLSGWHSYRKPSITDNGWIIKDSSVYLRGPAAGALLAPEQFVYRNFDISVDWKLPDSGNSGIFLRYLETEEKEATRTGPETQICGKLHPDYRGGTSMTSPGACYAMFAPSRPWIRPMDEFNTLRIIMYENRVAHYGNGVKLLEYVVGDSVWTARYAVSKYNTFPLYGDIHAGKLFLQDHQSHVWYRNVKIRPLTKDPWLDSAFTWPDRLVAQPRRRLVPGFILRVDGGQVRLSSDRPVDWDLQLHDITGAGKASFRGLQRDAVSRFALPPGRYFLMGALNGTPIPSAIPLTIP